MSSQHVVLLLLLLTVACAHGRRWRMAQTHPLAPLRQAVAATCCLCGPGEGSVFQGLDCT